MARKVRIGFTCEMFDKKGNFLTPGPGSKLLEEIPNVEWQMFLEYLPEVSSKQIEGFDKVVILSCEAYPSRGVERCPRLSRR